MAKKTITLNDMTHFTTIQDIKNMIFYQEGIPPNQQRLIHAGKQLEDNCTAYDCNIEREATIHLVHRLSGGGNKRKGNMSVQDNKYESIMIRDVDINDEKNIHMGLSVGGIINQKIYKDMNNIDDYDIYNVEKFELKIYNGQQLKNGLPYTPISMETYINYGYPWFKIYDEKIPAITNCLDIEPINLDNDAFPKIELTECCICMNKYENIEYYPCKHRVCSDCFVDQIKNNKDIYCHMCREKVLPAQINFLHDIIDLSPYDLHIDFNKILLIQC